MAPKKEKLRPVTESLRLDITAKLQEFRNDDSITELAFPANLSNDDRAVIHNQCKKLGLTSKSRGKGENRYCVVTKKNDLSSGGNGNATDQLLQKVEEGDSIKEAVKAFHFNEAVQQSIHRLFDRCPATPEEIRDLQKVHQSGYHAICSKAMTVEQAKVEQAHERGKTNRNKRAENWGADEVLQRFSDLEKRRSLNKPVQKRRERLPIASYEKEITMAVLTNQVVLIVGETGCGKSTQVPQMIADNLWQEGKPCRILISQPRRISAMSVAERIAAERGERIGDSVGYVVRLDKAGGAKSNIVFCTNGVLLRHFAMKGSGSSRNIDSEGSLLDGATHLIIDEIHERDRFADFLLIYLKRMLSQNLNLKVILMSATMQIEKFKDYFRESPVINVPGFTYPVDILYLEEILQTIKYRQGKNSLSERNVKALQNNHVDHTVKNDRMKEQLDSLLMRAFLQGSNSSIEELFEFLGSQYEAINWPHSATGATALMILASKGRYQECTNLLARGANALMQSNDGSSAVDWAAKFGHRELAKFLADHIRQAAKAQEASDQLAVLSLNEYVSSVDMEEVDIDLICAVIKHICHTETQKKAAILVFLPGWDDIQRTKQKLEKEVSDNTLANLLILPLHSQIAPVEQKLVFAPPKRRDQRKIILSTNIAETSVTIEDVVYVVDTGRAKENNYDPHMGVSTLQCEWISKANACQRKGRAGRCQRGVCFRLYSKARYEQSLPENPSPELLRAPLEQLCLQAKLLDFQNDRVDCTTLLSGAIEAPHPKSIENALQSLEAMDAIQRQSTGEMKSEDLTVLGEHLAKLPLDPRLGKSLLLAALMQSLSPMILLACFSSYRDPWVQPSDSSAQQLASAKKKSFAQVWSKGYSSGCLSDHLAAAGAYSSWNLVNSDNKWKYCYQNFLSSSTLSMIHGMRGQLESEMRSIIGLHHDKQIVPQIGLGPRIDIAGAGLMRAILAMGSYPQLGEMIGGSSNPRGMKPSIKTSFFKQKVKIHRGSLAYSAWSDDVAMQNKNNSLRLLCFDELVRQGGGLFAKSCTVVPLFSLLIMARKISIIYLDPSMLEALSTDDLIIAVDDWLTLRVKRHVFNQIVIFRMRFHKAFHKVVQNPKLLLQKDNKAYPPYLSVTVRTLVQILADQGDMSVQHGDMERTQSSQRAVKGTHNGSGGRKPVKFAVKKKR